MNKFLFLSAGMLTALLATSCSQEEVNPVVNGEMETFTISLPSDMTSRAFGDGMKAKNLYIAVYPKGDFSKALISNFADGRNAEAIEGSTTLTNLTTVINIQLVKNMQYDVVFFAESFTDGDQTNPFSISGPSLNVDYTKMAIDSEDYDAFFAAESFTSTGITHTVTLRRPFAQVNIGTNDLSQAKVAGLEVTKAGVTLSNLPTSLNMFEKTVGETTASATFAPVALSDNTDAEIFPVYKKDADGNTIEPLSSDYEYLTMAYVLAGDGDMPKSTVNTVSLILNDTETPFASYTQVPIQRNHRTNIFGSLITNPESFQVVLDSEFDKPANDLPQSWTLGVKAITPDEEGNYSVTAPAEMAWIAEQVKGGNNFEGKTITLTKDLDLSGQLWTPIGEQYSGATGEAGTQYFKGTFDGGEHTITGVTTNVMGDQAVSGFFGRVVGGAVIKNLTLKDVNITCEHYAGGLIGYAFINAWTNTKGTITIENCHVIGGTVTSVPTLQSNGKWDNGDKVGALVGYMGQCGITVNNCSVEGVTVIGYRGLGAFVGHIDGVGNQVPASLPYSGTGNTAKNITIIQNMLHNYKGLTPGEFVSTTFNASSMNGSIECTSTNVTIETVNYTAP